MNVLVFFITTDKCVSVLYSNFLMNVLVFFITTPCLCQCSLYQHLGKCVSVLYNLSLINVLAFLMLNE